MRKITKESINAFLNRREFKKQNMEVVKLGFNDYDNYYLQLHGNTIAVLYQDNKIEITNAGWESNTTKERLNGLIYLSGSNFKPIYQKNWVWYLNNEEWNGNFKPIN